MQKEKERRGRMVNKRNLELERKRRENDGALLLKHFSDIITGGRRQRQTDRLPHPSSLSVFFLRIKIKFLRLFLVSVSKRIIY